MQRYKNESNSQQEQFFNDEKAEEIKDLPQNFKDWLEFHKDEINKAKEKGKLPYFLRDNEGVINYSNNLKEYKKLLKDSNYYDVQIDRKTGGLKAISINRDTTNLKDSKELEIVDLLFSNGYKIILSDEDNADNSKRKFDGFINDKSMEMTTRNNADYKKVKDALNHCAKKKVAVAIVYCPNGVSSENLYRGLNAYYGLKNKNGFVDFENIYIIDKDRIIQKNKNKTS